MPPEPARLRVLYGGTFDPVHDGHVGVARHARDALQAEIRLVPAHDPPHKGPTRASAAQRAEMLGLAVRGEADIAVDLRELRRDGPSYTIDTLEELREETGPDAPLAILVGADSFRGLETWHRWRELFDLAHVVVARRAGSALGDALPPVVAEAAEGRWAGSAAALHEAPSGRVFVLDQPLFPESASEVRRRVAAGEPWHDLVPPAVAAYILEHGLYA